MRRKTIAKVRAKRPFGRIFMRTHFIWSIHIIHTYWMIQKFRLLIFWPWIHNLFRILLSTPNIPNFFDHCSVWFRLMIILAIFILFNNKNNNHNSIRLKWVTLKCWQVEWSDFSSRRRIQINHGFWLLFILFLHVFRFSWFFSGQSRILLCSFQFDIRIVNRNNVSTKDLLYHI